MASRMRKTSARVEQLSARYVLCFATTRCGPGVLVADPGGYERNEERQRKSRGSSKREIKVDGSITAAAVTRRQRFSPRSP